MRTRTIQTIIDTLEPVALEQGYELVDIEQAGTTRMPLLRVYLDKADGLTLDDIAAANSWLGKHIEEIDPFRGAYTLEVSSPGIDRPLRTREHFERFLGQDVHVVTKPQEHYSNRGKWTGTLVGVEGEKVHIELDNTIYSLDIADIKKAHLKGIVDFKQSLTERNG